MVKKVAGGVGGMTLKNSSDATSLGISADKTYLTTNIGGGVRLFTGHHWGLRGDYRYFMVHSNTDTVGSFFEGSNNRRAHRLFGSVVLTW